MKKRAQSTTNILDNIGSACIAAGMIILGSAFGSLFMSELDGLPSKTFGGIVAIYMIYVGVRIALRALARTGFIFFPPKTPATTERRKITAI